ncbi:hypothetical protein SLE2022_114630 [Rubroshorea leprosula]
MENEEAISNITSPSNQPSNRPIINLLLGVSLLLISLFCVSTLLSYCLNWLKLRTLLRSSLDDTDGRDVRIDFTHHLPEEAADHAEKRIRETEEQSMPVVMPGDRVPKFIAIACPSESPVVRKLTVIRAEAKPSTLPVVTVPVPLYL